MRLIKSKVKIITFTKYLLNFKRHNKINKLKNVLLKKLKT